jgi:endonuclease YncB( thermonuclease family)
MSLPASYLLSCSMKAAAVFTLLVWLCASAAASEWETIRSCRLIENESNDGDSFHVDADGEERIFRLYFVDAPETDDNGRMADRIAEQAELFGITEEESLAMGKKAAAFTRAVLSRPFAVTTRGQNARGASEIKREYAFVETADGEDLGEMLVARGLARSFGQVATLKPYTAAELREKYDRLEDQARRERVGAWGDGSATPTMKLANQESQPDDKAVTPRSNVIATFGDLTLGSTEDQFRRHYPQAQRGEDWQSETETLHTYVLLPPDSMDADNVRFIFRSGRLIQMDHTFSKKRLEERGGDNTDGKAISQLFGNEGEPCGPHELELLPKVKSGRMWRSPSTGEAATLEIHHDGSAQVSFHRVD